MTVAPAPVLVPQLQPQAIALSPGLAGRVVDPDGLAHLRQGGGGQQAAGRARSGAGPGARARQEAAQRARSATVVHSWPAGPIAAASCSGSGSSRSACGCTAKPRGVRRLRPGRGPGHAERREQLSGDHVVPGLVPDRAHEVAEQREPHVGVMELAAGPVPPGVRPERRLGQRLERRSRYALPPRPGGFGSQARGLRQHLANRQARHVRRVEVLAHRVGQVELALIAQSHHRRGDERLGDRAGPVLDVRVRDRAVRSVNPAAPARPDQRCHGAPALRPARAADGSLAPRAVRAASSRCIRSSVTVAYAIRPGAGRERRVRETEPFSSSRDGPRTLSETGG